MFFNPKKHFKKDQYKTFHTTSITLESGRTMTEMLGMLAIIGVLSIGSIAGYSYAMDKYRANVTINDINLRAMDLVTQAAQDQPLSLSEWDNTSMAGYTFSEPAWADDGTITFDISGLPKGVCEILTDTLSDRFDLAVNGTLYTGNTSGCGSDNVITIFFDESGTGLTCNPACKKGQICEDGICLNRVIQPGTAGFACMADADCPECMACTENICQWVANGTTCSIGTCQNGNCKGDLCANNNDCPIGSFCVDSAASCTISNPNRCQKLEFVRKIITLSTGITERWYISRMHINWWDAKSACEKMGASMVSADELVEGYNPNYCGWRTYVPMERSIQLSTIIGNNYVWTHNVCENNTCLAFLIFLSNGSIGYHYRNSNYGRDTGRGILALCH